MTSFTFIGLGLITLVFSTFEFYKVAKNIDSNITQFVNENWNDKIQIIYSSIMLGIVLIAFGMVKFYI